MVTQTDRGKDGMVTQEAALAQAAREIASVRWWDYSYPEATEMIGRYLADYEAAIKRQAAQRCAEIADATAQSWASQGGDMNIVRAGVIECVAGKIRREFSLDGKEQS